MKKTFLENLNKIHGCAFFNFLIFQKATTQMRTRLNKIYYIS